MENEWKAIAEKLAEYLEVGCRRNECELCTLPCRKTMQDNSIFPWDEDDWIEQARSELGIVYKNLTQKDVDALLTGLSGGAYYRRCPFCDAPSQEIKVQRFWEMYSLTCTRCGYIGPSGKTREEAEEKWNKRSDDE